MFHEKWRNYHDSRGGTDTPGPGESVSAIRFIGKLYFSKENMEFQNIEKNKKIEKSRFSWNIQKNPGVPGVEPILLDLENPFLLSVPLEKMIV